MAHERHDALLMEILEERKSVIGFMETMFGFLARRTDFYCEMKSDKDTIGFPPGIKEQIVLKMMRKFDHNRIRALQALSSETTPEVNANCEHLKTPNQEKPKTMPCKVASKKEETFDDHEFYNGAAYGNYCWSQSISEIELFVLLPEHIISSKQLSISIGTHSIRVSEKSSPENLILEGNFTLKCRNTESCWSMVGKKLQITLDKVKESWWDRFLDTEPQLDLKRLDCSRPMEELPQESKVAIEKLRWEQNQKMMGVPTSDELKKREILRAAWDVEGSPFQGKPFDPSLVQFN